MSEQYCIWWTSQDEYEAIGNKLPDSIPDYIYQEFRSRFGRNGRGRLWVAEDIPIEEITWNENKPAARLANSRGGIVIRVSDVHHLFDLPGFVTDLELNFINSWGER